jgi:hypothetical protein
MPLLARGKCPEQELNTWLIGLRDVNRDAAYIRKAQGNKGSGEGKFASGALLLEDG